MSWLFTSCTIVLLDSLDYMKMYLPLLLIHRELRYLFQTLHFRKGLKIAINSEWRHDQKQCLQFCVLQGRKLNIRQDLTTHRSAGQQEVETKTKQKQSKTNLPSCIFLVCWFPQGSFETKHSARLSSLPPGSFLSTDYTVRVNHTHTICMARHLLHLSTPCLNGDNAVLEEGKLSVGPFAFKGSSDKILFP